MMLNKTVIILGGGVAGMSAAHELIERGFKVVVLEKHNTLVGGKARSIPVPDSASAKRKSLPGEHGFRFFPGFYKNIIDTMERIPFPIPGSAAKVSDNLVGCSSIMIARNGKEPIRTPAHFPKTYREIMDLLSHLFKIETGMKPGESRDIALKIWQLMTSCDERWEDQYEKIGWWQFTEADNYSDAYKRLFVEGLTRTLVAAKAEKANTRTNGKILLQMLFNLSNPSVPTDRVLNGPTNDMWLNPWLIYLQTCGVEYNFGCEVLGIECDNEKITKIRAANQNGFIDYHGDYYVCAMPVERAAKLVTPVLLNLDPGLQKIITLSTQVAWMNGIQFYLREDVKISEGHIILVESAWALTAISQIQFWKDFDLSDCGDGLAKGIISVDVCNWEREGILFNRSATKCTKKEVISDVWAQLKLALNTEDILLVDSNLHSAYVDEGLIFSEDILAPFESSKNSSMNEMSNYGKKSIISNEEPLLVNEVDSWKNRNEAATAIPNLFLASDYIRNNTNLATMEGANEAARLAVNGILEEVAPTMKRCSIEKLKEPRWLNFFKFFDRVRYRRENKWTPFPWYIEWIGKVIATLF